MVFTELFIYLPKACHPYSFGFLGLCEFYEPSAVLDETSLELHDKQAIIGKN